MSSGLWPSITRFITGMRGSSSRRARSLGTVCPVMCVMSGDFVQRGSPAVYSKFARAEAAVRCGADLVLELPLPWSLSSAEGFARGAVGLLGSLGVVTHLSFGSECGELDPLQRVAEALLDPLLGEDLRAELRSRHSRLRRRASRRSRGAWARSQSCCRRRTTSLPWSISRRSMTSAWSCTR